MNLTIKDIAQMANVSQGTVSKVINNYEGISEKTKKKVMDIINQSGYEPNFSARSLATKKSNLIGLIYAGRINVDMTHPYFNEVISSFKKNIGLLGYDILMFSNEHFQSDNGSYLARCRHFNVDGCLIIAGEEVEESTYALALAGLPCIGIDIELKGPKASYIMTDNLGLSRKVVEYLYLHAIKKIGFIGGIFDSPVSIFRKKGFLEALNQFGLEICEDWIQYGDFHEESGYAAMKKILCSKTLPEAIFATSDMMALGALQAIKEAGLSCPDDIRLIGCDDIAACRYSSPKLTTVKQDKEKFGKLSAYMLDDLINDRSQLKPVFIDSELIIRESC
ncbi:LacI family transcriptional regulator [Pradoshia sp. D12]|uniref:LacI family DNA-binding transcriptional regulator n=1 Tax=Bacillaceae TaxID=186817 RepID=UPI00080AF2BC|nr:MULTISPECIES: LacI family DNA-binding transcriptional regulator [Bacillaceae]OCA83400.1 transcriptional regulator [Bacillus sp. FJAT-27986]QFK71637.1 LacI family transcriptional regulator [Pradoshia sp. D12]TPF73432.1 LacI family transcriptional regulator [Bacillus sp. D12]